MPSSERDDSREGDRQHLRHSHSASSDQGSRALVPMWDSSDPDRAPPPLPLNPQSPTHTSRAGTSSAIKSAHAALSERARESRALVPSLAARRLPDATGSPERPSHRAGPAHKRMQSLQPGSVRDLSLMIEGSQSPSTSPTRSPERQSRAGTPTTAPPPKEQKETRPRESDDAAPVLGPTITPIIRPTVRRPPSSILGENTPPQSSTMLALQSMSSQSSLRDSEPLTNITNSSSAVTKVSQNGDNNLSAQILGLTSIATSLQKEMAALSRRSRDNATDLSSLKEATNSRDEDIRKSLRELMGNLGDFPHRIGGGEAARGLFLDNKPHDASSSRSTGFQLPRIPSPRSFADSLDAVSTPTPSVSNSDAAASLVLIEKIVREMGTKEGQGLLLDRLAEVSAKMSGMATATKIDDLAKSVRAQAEQAVVTGRPRGLSFDEESRGLELEYSQAAEGGPMIQRVERLLNLGDTRRSSAPTPRGAELVNDDLMKIIRSVKDSISQGGGMTAEVKTLVRELRGEVLGMGREIGKRLDQVGNRSIEEADAPTKDDVSRVIDEGLEQMKDQLNHVLREHRRQSAASASSQKTMVDYQEIYNAMRAALRDNEATTKGEMPDLSRDDVIEAVREAWENYKPEISVEQIGLERDEVLACLQEGLQEYAHQDVTAPGATREEVFKAVVEGFKHFTPPQMDSPATLSRDEIIEAVRDCLEEFEFPVAASAAGAELTREEMVHAVREGLGDLELPQQAIVPGVNNDEVMSRLQDILELMRLEFRSVSEEAKDNVAANGRDTEQVLDATKDGFENLRAAIEGYVDRAAGVSGQEQFLDDLLKSMDDFKEDLAGLIDRSTDASREQLKVELEGLREMVNSSMVPAMSTAAPSNNKEMLEALQTGVNNLRQEILRPRPETGEILDALNDGLNDIRAGMDRMAHKPVDLTATDEILTALRDGLDSVKNDIETLRGVGNDRAVGAVATVDDEPEAHNAVVPADMLKQDDIKNLEVLITQLRIKVEAMEPAAEPETHDKEDLERLENMLRSIQEGVDGISSREVPQKDEASSDAPTANGDAATRDDVQAIETILRNTKARLDDLMDSEQAVRKEHLDVIETLLLESRESMTSVTEQVASASHKEDLSALEALVTQVTVSIEEFKEQATQDGESTDKVTKSDIEAVEQVVLEVKTGLDGLIGTDFAAISTKEDFAALGEVISEAKITVEDLAVASTKAQEERQAEIVGVGERVSEVKAFLEEFQDAVKSKLEDSTGGVESLSKLLETMGKNIDKNDSVGDDLKEMFETMKTEFDDSKNIVAGAKLETDEKLQQSTESITGRIDDKIGELMAKYDEFEATLNEKKDAGEARDVEMEAAVVGTKAVADELKLLIDTLGSSVTESLEKMEEASKTVFDKVEDLVTRTDDVQTERKTEHQETQDHIQHAVSLVEGLQGELQEVQPQILEAVKDILLLVGQHYEHSKTSTSDIHDKLVEAKVPDQPLLPPPEKYDDSEVREQLKSLVEQKYDDSDLREKLDRIAEQKYDDSNVNEKLDKLVDGSDATHEALTQLDKLDQVHQSVVRTAADISEFLSSQTQRVLDEHEDREKTLQDTNIALERRLAERDHLEASILSLKDEEDRLRNGVVGLRTEQESLIRQKTRLTGDVSSLETAMRLRKEELSDMECRAESLERRIVEGVMDHSRILLMSKATKDKDAMSRKRVRKANAEGETAPKTTRPTAMNVALSTKRNTPSSQPGTPRRIVSLSQMNSNVPAGGVKRSQSVRTPAGAVVSARAMRKRSWGGDLAKSILDEGDKENQGALEQTVEELEEPDTPTAHALVPLDDPPSDTETLRRTSHGTAGESYTGSEFSSDYDETASEWTESHVGRMSDVGTEAGAEGDMVVYGS